MENNSEYIWAKAPKLTRAQEWNEQLLGAGILYQAINFWRDSQILIKYE
jgi:hypothetical protein